MKKTRPYFEIFLGSYNLCRETFFPVIDISLSEIADADLSFFLSILSISQR